MIDGVHLEWRTWRWLGLTETHVVMRADDATAWARLEREAALLARWDAPFLPRVVAIDRGRRVQVRDRMNGIGGLELERAIFGTTATISARDRYRHDCPLTAFGERFARELGAALSRLHTLGEAEGRAIGIAPWSSSLAAAIASIEAHAPDLRAAIDGARAFLDVLPPDPVVVHGDPHLFNMVAADDGALRGIFDIDDASIAHRAHDLRYLISHGPRFERAALEAYGHIDEDVVHRMHVICALEHFAFIAPDAPRFPSIVEWSRAALHTFASDWR